MPLEMSRHATGTLLTLSASTSEHPELRPSATLMRGARGTLGLYNKGRKAMCRAGQHRPRPPLVTHHNTPTQTKILGGAAPRGHLSGSSASPPPVQELSGSNPVQPSTSHSADTGAPMFESSKGPLSMMVAQKGSPQRVCVHTCDKSPNAKISAARQAIDSTASPTLWRNPKCQGFLH